MNFLSFIRQFIFHLKMKLAFRWIKQAGLHVVRVEHVAGTDYLVTPDGQRYRAHFKGKHR